MASTSKNNRETIIIIDDDSEYRTRLAEILEDDYEVLHATMIKTGRLRIEQGADLVLLDIRFGKDVNNRDGLDLLEEIVALRPTLPVVMMTGYADLSTALRSLKTGAADFIQKDNFDLRQLEPLVSKTIQRFRLQFRVDVIERRLKQHEASELIGSSKPIQQIRENIDAIASNGVLNVLITGETGTGKEVVARMIHSRGPRAKKPFISVSVAALSAETIDSELFGSTHVSSKDMNHVGFLEQANGGVLFLDEISELGIALQGKLLRAIDENSFSKVGSPQKLHVNLQVIAATNKDIGAAVSRGEFRQDLFFRLNGFHLQLPPLRECVSDVPAMVESFLHELRSQGRTRIQEIDDEAIHLLMGYQFPGNVRELRSIIERSVLMAQSRLQRSVTKNDLPLELLDTVNQTSHFSIRWAGKSKVLLDREIAIAELMMLDVAMRTTAGRKSEACDLLGITYRHALPRKIARIRRDFPDVLFQFKELIEYFPEGIEDDS